MKPECIFCKIIAGEIPCYKVYEDEGYIAFLDISQFTPGHTLLIPKQHIDFIWDSSQIGDYMKVAKKIANHYKLLGYKYVDSLSFGRQIAHAHLHLIPHNGDDTEWNNALKSLEFFTNSKTSRLSKDKGLSLLSKLKLN